MTDARAEETRTSPDWAGDYSQWQLSASHGAIAGEPRARWIVYDQATSDKLARIIHEAV